MFVTPYAYSNDTLENACLYYSDDGFVWHVPPGVKNPIGTPIESEYKSNAYGSDLMALIHMVLIHMVLILISYTILILENSCATM